jgi:hypothetical protein
MATKKDDIVTERESCDYVVHNAAFELADAARRLQELAEKAGPRAAPTRQGRSARGRIAAAAADHGWHEMFGDAASNVRAYERSGRVILVGYRPEGAVTSASRMYVTASTVPRNDMPVDGLRYVDRGKAEQVLAWLGEAEAVR